jgi:hypothetical protein
MKKALFLILFFAIAATIAAAPAYQAYYASRAEAKACEKAGNTTCAVAAYLAAEAAAIAQAAANTPGDKVDWQSNADWQRNNAGFCLIAAQAAGPARDIELLKQALAIFKAREIKTPAVAAMIKKNIEYCETQIKN